MPCCFVKLSISASGHRSRTPHFNQQQISCRSCKPETLDASTRRYVFRKYSLHLKLRRSSGCIDLQIHFFEGFLGILVKSGCIDLQIRFAEGMRCMLDRIWCGQTVDSRASVGHSQVSFLLCLLQVASLSAGCRKHRESILRPEAFKVFTRKPYTPKPSLITRTKPIVPVR